VNRADADVFAESGLDLRDDGTSVSVVAQSNHGEENGLLQGAQNV
jgi:hypothetical protein